jgi:hypothetical protein
MKKDKRMVIWEIKEFIKDHFFKIALVLFVIVWGLFNIQYGVATDNTTYIIVENTSNGYNVDSYFRIGNNVYVKGKSMGSTWYGYYNFNKVSVRKVVSNDR